MHRHIARIKGLGFIFWHAKHELMHALLGVAWAWVLREIWGELQPRWIILAIFGSLLPDLEHFVYVFTYGRKDIYSQMVVSFLRQKKWRMLTVHIEHGHKTVTNLMYHNVYVVAGLGVIVSVCWMFEWRSWVVVVGAMVIHYLFDIVDDVMMFGRPNPNWKRWGNGKKKPRGRG